MNAGCSQKKSQPKNPYSKKSKWAKRALLYYNASTQLAMRQPTVMTDSISRMVVVALFSGTYTDSVNRANQDQFCLAVLSGNAAQILTFHAQ